MLLLIWGCDQYSLAAAHWHDGQMTHDTYALFARRANHLIITRRLGNRRQRPSSPPANDERVRPCGMVSPGSPSLGGAGRAWSTFPTHIPMSATPSDRVELAVRGRRAPNR